MEQLYTATFCASFFSIMFVLALLVRQQTLDIIIKPNSVLPAGLQFFTSSPMAPWRTSSGGKVVRDKITCKTALCLSKAFVIQLPMLENPERPNGWDTVSNAWTLTDREFMTKDPQKYPFATVVLVPKNTPDHVRFILPQLRPANQDELNVTGEYENAFVVFNQSKNEMLFFRTSKTYWSLKPNSRTLVWPANVSPSNSWNAYTLKNETTEEEAANYAEILMYDRA